MCRPEFESGASPCRQGATIAGLNTHRLRWNATNASLQIVAKKRRTHRVPIRRQSSSSATDARFCRVRNEAPCRSRSTFCGLRWAEYGVEASNYQRFTPPFTGSAERGNHGPGFGDLPLSGQPGGFRSGRRNAGNPPARRPSHDPSVWSGHEKTPTSFRKSGFWTTCYRRQWWLRG